MNTIKIYLSTNGSVATLQKDFPLYQGAYQNKLINVCVPTSVLAPNYLYANLIGEISGVELPSNEQLNAFVQSHTSSNRLPKNGDIVNFVLLEAGTLNKTFYQYTASVVNDVINWTSQIVTSFGTGAIAGTSVKISATYVARNGALKYSDSYFMRYLKTFTYQGVEYALYERMLPSDFTAVAGQGANALKLIINVVNVQVGTENEAQPKVLSIITSQTTSLDVMPSANLDQENTIDASQAEEMQAQINALNKEIVLLQRKYDEFLNTNNKTIVGGINEVNRTNDEQATQIGNLQQASADLNNRVDYLYQNIAKPEEYIDTLKGNTLPTQQQLNNYTQELTGRPPENNDVIIFVLEVENKTDRNYKYTFGKNGWTSYEIPLIEQADNTTLGIIKGTYVVGATANLLVDISGGEIQNIYVKDNDGRYRQINEYANALNTTINDIINGDQVVMEAMKALEDGLGNNIVNTYMTQNAGATKAFVRDYALPREFNDIYYLEENGYSKDVPTSPESGIQFSATSTEVGDLTLIDLQKEEENDFELSAKNSSITNIFVSANANASVQFRLTTQAKIGVEEWQDLSIELTEDINLIAGQITKLSFGGAFTSLSNKVLSFVANEENPNYIRQILEVVTQSSEEVTFDVYSNETYPSSFSLNVLAQRIITSEGLMGELPVVLGNGVYDADNGILTFNVPENATFNNNTDVFVSLNYADGIVGLSSDTQVVLSWRGQNIRLVTPYNIPSGNPTLEQLGQVFIDNNVAIGTNLMFKGYVRVVASDEITIQVNEDNLSDYYTSEEVDTQIVNNVGKINQVSFNGVLENNQIIATLDTSIADFNFVNSTRYLIHLYLPLVTLTGDLDNSYPILFQDKNGSPIYLNSIFENNLGQTSNVGQVCQLQNFIPQIGYTWDFSVIYREIDNNGENTLSFYVENVTRENVINMTAVELENGIINASIKTGTCVIATTSGGDYIKGHTYLVNGSLVDGTLVLTTEDVSSDFASQEDIANAGYASTTYVDNAIDTAITGAINRSY